MRVYCSDLPDAKVPIETEEVWISGRDYPFSRVGFEIGQMLTDSQRKTIIDNIVMQRSRPDSAFRKVMQIDGWGIYYEIRKLCRYIECDTLESLLLVIQAGYYGSVVLEIEKDGRLSIGDVQRS